MEQALPFVFWLSGVYHWLLFHAEWKECAEPHRNQLGNALSKVNQELLVMRNGYESISKNLDSAITILLETTAPFVLSNIKFAIRSMVSGELDERVAVIDRYYKNISRNYEQRITGLSQEAQKIISKFRESINEEFGEVGNIVQESFVELEGFVLSSFHEYEGIIANFGEFVFNDAMKSATDYRESSSITSIELQQSHRSVSQIVDLSNEIARNVQFYKSRADNLGDLVYRLRSFSDKKRTFVRAKTDFSGLFVPFILCFIASTGIISHYIFKIQQFLLNN